MAVVRRWCSVTATGEIKSAGIRPVCVRRGSAAPTRALKVAWLVRSTSWHHQKHPFQREFRSLPKHRGRWAVTVHEHSAESSRTFLRLAGISVYRRYPWRLAFLLTFGREHAVRAIAGPRQQGHRARVFSMARTSLGGSHTEIRECLIHSPSRVGISEGIEIRYAAWGLWGSGWNDVAVI